MTEGPTVRIGVIGRGFGARVVAPVFAETDGCMVIDVVTARDVGAVDDLCARPDVDLVCVHSPPFLHVDHVRRAVSAGKAVLCEKPFGRDAGEATEMSELARDAGVVNLVNFQFRHHPGREALRALVLDGSIGAPEHVQWSQFSSASRLPLRRYDWLYDRSRGGGWIGAWGSHALDFLRWTLGEIPDASAELRTTIPERPDVDGRLHRCTAEDGFTATLRTAEGVTVAIDSTFVSPVHLPSRITVVGGDGVLESIGDQRIVLRTRSAVEETFEVDHEGTGSNVLPMRRFAPVVRDAVRTGTVAPDDPTFADGLACARLMDALRAD